MKKKVYNNKVEIMLQSNFKREINYKKKSSVYSNTKDTNFIGVKCAIY